MALFSTKENPTEIVAVFDIGNGTVTGALVEMVRGVKPTIIFLEKTEILSTDESFSSLFGATTKAIEFVGYKLLEAKRGAPTRTFCFLSTPWYAGQTRVIKMSKSAPFIFTKKIWQGLIDKELKRFVEETMIENSDAVLIENKNMSILLDGKEAMDPIDKKTTSIELSVFFSISSGNILESFRMAINRSFSHAPITFGSFLFTSFMTIRDAFLGEASDAILVDIGSRITEIAYVRRDTIVSTASFPAGTFQIKTAIQKTFGLSKQEIESLLHLYNSNRLETNKSKKISTIISREVEKWYTLFDTGLKSLCTDTLPQYIYITIDEDVKPLFRFEQELTQKRSITKIIVLDGSTFFAHVRPEHASYRDPFIMLETLSLNRIMY